MAHSMSEELYDLPSPAGIMRMASIDDKIWDRVDIGTDLQHSGRSITRRCSSNLQRGHVNGIESFNSPREDRAANMRSSLKDTQMETVHSHEQQQKLQEWEYLVSASSGRCVVFEEAPRYLRREFILSGYYVGGSHLDSIRRTLLGWNNETLNAWTMVAGILVCAVAWSYGRQTMPQHHTVFFIMALSSLPHAPFSISLHAMIGVSERSRDTLRTLDVFFILTSGGGRQRLGVGCRGCRLDVFYILAFEGGCQGSVDILPLG